MAPTIPSPKLTIHPDPLTPTSFAPFGTVIVSPLPPSRKTLPHPAPQSSQVANQGTALKYPNISPLASTYRLSASGAPAEPKFTLFASFPRTLRTSPSHPSDGILDVRLLERHPYTTQTFVPLASHTPTAQKKNKYIVIVAPTLPAPEPGVGLTPYSPQITSSSQGGLPDLQKTRAFVAEPGTAVTYGIGIWHAPMVVVGDGRIDFVVTQWMSGKEGEDCQEVDLGARYGEGIEVVIPDWTSEKERSKL